MYILYTVHSALRSLSVVLAVQCTRWTPTSYIFNVLLPWTDDDDYGNILYNMIMLKVDDTDDGTDTDPKEYAGGLKGYYGVSW